MITHGEMSIYEAMRKIQSNNFVIPAFQRNYVWTIDQVSCLWDSILSDYPISTFLLWKIDAGNISNDTTFFQFIKNAKFRKNKNLSENTNNGDDAEWRGNDRLEMAVLDGQQRLTSLYISLYGQGVLVKGRNSKYAGEPMDLCIQLDKNAIRDLSDDDVHTEYDIGFYEVSCQSPTLFKIRNLLTQVFFNPTTRDAEIQHVLNRVPENSREYAKNILSKLCQKIYDEKIIQYQQISGTENDALDMFVRFNNGGTRLSRSEIGEATIEAYWPDSYKSLSQVCYYKNNKSYESYHLTDFKEYKDYPLDFIIRLSIVLFERNINTNLHRGLVENIKYNWNKIKDALLRTQEFIHSIRKIHIEDFSNRWNILIPIVYLVYKHIQPEMIAGKYCYDEGYLSCRKAVEAYISRAILFKFYSNATTSKLSKLKSEMDRFSEDGYPRLTMQILDSIPELKATNEKVSNLLDLKKGDTICEMALWLISSERIEKEKQFNPDVEYDVDHIHPRITFTCDVPHGMDKNVWFDWRQLCEKMPNLSLLDSIENREVKNDFPLEAYVNGLSEVRQKNYKADHLIPETDLSLNNFEVFFEKRKATLKEELGKLLHKDEDDGSTIPKEYAPKEDSPKEYASTSSKNESEIEKEGNPKVDSTKEDTQKEETPKEDTPREDEPPQNEPKTEMTDEDESTYPPALQDSHVYDSLNDMSDSDSESLSNLSNIEEEIEEYNNENEFGVSFMQKIISDSSCDNPVFKLACTDRDLMYAEKKNIEESFKEPAYKQNMSFFVDDRDGTRYQTIKIGNQEWMAENLRFIMDGAFRGEYKDEDFLKNQFERGLFYRRDVVVSAAPIGWRIPEKKDFEELLASVKNNYDVLKACKYWSNSYALLNIEESGFNALPVGHCDKNGKLWGYYDAYFWTLDSEKDDWGRRSNYYMHLTTKSAIISNSFHEGECYSIRCIKI